MKKLLMVLALASVSVAGMAQDEVPAEKYSVSTNSFWSNWFIQVGVNWNAGYVGTDNLLSNPFYKFPLGADANDNDHAAITSLGFSAAIGKWFTPGLGLRTKANGAWLGKAFSSDVPMYLAVNEQVLFNLHNMLGGYDENRCWNFIPFIGAGLAHTFKVPTGWGKAGTYTFSIGLLNTFKLSQKLAANVELGYTNFGKEIVNVPTGGGIMPKNRYNQFSLEVGITYNLGKATWNKTPDVEALKALSQSQIDALNAQLADEQAENARLKNMLANQKATAGETKTVTVKEVVAAPVSVFFNIGKSKIASRKDVQNVKDLVEVAKANNSKIVVTGYADSKTGSAEFNQKLSQKRAETVADELVKLGMSRDNIEVVAAGGVNTLTPISYNRRATVEIKK